MSGALVIRLARESDIPSLEEISALTWEGFDYLGRTARSWLEQGGLYVGETAGRVVAVGKLSRMPGRVVWLEGLRVHPEHRGRGFGRAMADHVLGKAREELDAGTASSVEFSTYVGNSESRAISESQGFRVFDTFHIVHAEDTGPAGGTETAAISVSAADLSVYPVTVPAGWKHARADAPDLLGWLPGVVEAWTVPSGASFMTSRRDCEASPLAGALSDPEGFLSGARAVAASKGMDGLELVIHSSMEGLLRHALASGFSYWDDLSGANMLVYRLMDRQGLSPERP